jgi:glyoxylase-like metal-dependent hydrolase (beta-lactamase superfamily II)
VVVGAVEVTPALDAVGTLAELSMAYPYVPADEWAQYRSLYPELFAETRWRLPVNAYVLRAGATTLLVDTGLGPPGLWTFWEPEQEGLLPAGLRRVGIERERIDIVFLTHLHIDHVGWNTDENGDVLFPRARYITNRDALAYALSDADRSHIRR